jgi:signal transduction histidine kinase
MTQAQALDTAIFSVGSILTLGCAAFIYRRRAAHPRAAWFLIAYLLLSALAFAAQALFDLGWFPSLGVLSKYRLLLYSLYLLSIVFVFLSRAFLHRSDLRGRWWAAAGAWTAMILIVDVNLFLLPEMLWISNGLGLERQLLVNGMLITGWSVCMLGAALLTFHAGRRAQPPLYSNPTLYWAWVCAITIIGGFFFFTASPALGMTNTLLAMYLAGYATGHLRLPDLRKLARKALKIVITTGLSILFYALVFILLETTFHGWQVENLVISGAILATTVVLVFNPLLAFIQKIVDRLIPGSDQDAPKVLRRYSQSITNILDLHRLAEVAIGIISETVEVSGGYLMMVDYEKDSTGNYLYRLRGVSGKAGDNDPEPMDLPENDPLALYFCQDHRPLTQAEVQMQTRLRGIAAARYNWIANLGADVSIGIYTKMEWIGLLALKPKKSGASFQDEDLELLALLANQTAVALENVRLVEGLMRLNAELKRANSALDQAKHHLERLDRTKSDFISIASHELRTPLTLVSASAQMLLQESELRENNFYLQLLEKIGNGSQRLHSIVEAMLDMAKIDSRELQLDRQSVQIKPLVERVIQEMSKGAQARQLTLEGLDLDALPAIEGDPSALEKVLRHLIANAIKYTPDGGRIVVTGAPVDSQSDLAPPGVELVVSDTGIGIDPALHELIFVKFYQTGELALHSSGPTKFKGGGPGLGLAISRGIVEAHGGQLWVESPGYDEIACPGSRFHILLPIRYGDFMERLALATDIAPEDTTKKRKKQPNETALAPAQ